MPRGATARLFVAVDPPAAVCEALAGVGARGGRGHDARAHASGGRAAARLLDRELLHLTLCFLGSRPVGEIEALAAALERLRRATRASCRSARRCGCRRGARTRWRSSSTTAGGELPRLHEDVSRGACAASTWEPERRRFRPHVTVARMRGGGRRADAWRAPMPLPATPAGCVHRAESLSLYRSRLDAAGASYEALASVPARGRRRLSDRRHGRIRRRHRLAHEARSPVAGAGVKPSAHLAPSRRAADAAVAAAAGAPTVGAAGFERVRWWRRPSRIRAAGFAALRSKPFIRRARDADGWRVAESVVPGRSHRVRCRPRTPSEPSRRRTGGAPSRSSDVLAHRGARRSCPAGGPCGRAPADCGLARGACGPARHAGLRAGRVA